MIFDKFSKFENTHHIHYMRTPQLSINDRVFISYDREDRLVLKPIHEEEFKEKRMSAPCTMKARVHFINSTGVMFKTDDGNLVSLFFDHDRKVITNKDKKDPRSDYYIKVNEVTEAMKMNRLVIA